MITKYYIANGKNLTLLFVPNFQIFTVCNTILSDHLHINTTYVYSLYIYIALMMLRCSDETLAH